MAIIIEVRFAHEHGALADTLREIPELVVSSVHETSTSPEQNIYFFRFDNISPETLRPALEDDHTVREAKPVPSVDDQRLWGIEFAPETKLLAPEVTKEAGFVLDAHSSLPHRTPRGWRERWFFRNQEGINDVWKHAREAGFEFEVLNHTRQTRSSIDRFDLGSLTEQQRTTLVAAYERGYYEEPREASLEELADSFGLSPSAVNGRLRRGLKSLIGAMLVVDEPGTALSRAYERNAMAHSSESTTPSGQSRVDDDV